MQLGIRKYNAVWPTAYSRTLVLTTWYDVHAYVGPWAIVRSFVCWLRCRDAAP